MNNNHSTLLTLILANTAMAILAIVQHVEIQQVLYAYIITTVIRTVFAYGDARKKLKDKTGKIVTTVVAVGMLAFAFIHAALISGWISPPGWKEVGILAIPLIVGAGLQVWQTSDYAEQTIIQLFTRTIIMQCAVVFGIILFTYGRSWLSILLFAVIVVLIEYKASKHSLQEVKYKKQ